MTPRRRAAALVGAALLAAALLPAGEAVIAARRTYLGAADAPPVRGTFGSGAAALDLAVLGDSTGAGVGVRQTGDTVGGRLAQALADSGRSVRLSGFAVSGARAADLSAQVDRALSGPAPDLAVVLVGANDATHLTPPSEAARDLAAAVTRLRSAGTAVVVGTCPDLGAARAFLPPLRQLSAWQGRRVAAASTPAVREAGGEPVDLARLTGPAFRADPATLSSDLFHPSALGYRLWAEALLPAVRDAAGG